MKDGEYINGFLVNDQAAIGEFYGKHYRAFVGHFAKRYKKPEEYAQDLFHDSLIAMQENIRNGKLTEQNLRCPLYKYLLMIGVHKMMAADRKTNDLNRIAMEGYADEDGEIILPKKIVKAIVDAAADEENEQRAAALGGFVERAVEDMRPPCDSLLRHFYWDRMSYAQIITVMDFATADSAKTQKNKCMNKLKPVVEKFRNLG